MSTDAIIQPVLTAGADEGHVEPDARRGRAPMTRGERARLVLELCADPVGERLVIGH